MPSSTLLMQPSIELPSIDLHWDAVPITVVRATWTSRQGLLPRLRRSSGVVSRRVAFWVWIFFIVLLSSGVKVSGQEYVSSASEMLLDGSGPGSPPPPANMEERMSDLERQNAILSQQQASLLAELEHLTEENRKVLREPWQFTGYDRELGAFTLVRGSPEKPYELRADVWAEARYLNFSANRNTWTDSTGATLPISSLDSIEITRNFINLSGYAMDPKLQYSAFFFSSTASNQTVYLGWINYQFSEAFDVRVGNWLVPGTREWLDSFRYTLGAERLMATTFFRPNISPGIWAQGKLWEQLNYRVMLANSVNRFTQGIERVGSSKALGMTAYWEPTNDFGPGPSDMEGHETPSLRLGTSMVFSEEANQNFGELGTRNSEDTILRLSDGTPLFRPGALGPGSQLRSARVNLWALDAAVKYRGWSVSGEYLLRLLNDFEGSPTPPPRSSIFDHGGLLQVGTMVVPRQVEAFGRTSLVTGPFGTGYEYGGGLNWYLYGTRDCRLTAEVLQIRDSPAQNILTGYRAGASGTLLQLQCFVDF